MDNIEFARSVALEIATKRWLSLGTSLPKASLVIKLISLLRDTRLYLIVDDEDLAALWDDLRQDQEMTDFLIMSAIDLKFRLPVGVAAGYETVIERLSVAYGSVGDGATAIDMDTVDRLPTTESHRRLLKANGWYLFLLLLETTNVFEITTNVSEVNHKEVAS